MPDTFTDTAHVRIERHYPNPVAQVWRAWTDPQALSRWFGMDKPGAATHAEIDLRPGGRYRIVTTLPDGSSNDVSGSYIAVEPLQRLVFTWAWRSTPERVSRVTIDFSSTGDGTTLCFVHDRFFDEQALRNHARGWPAIFALLDAELQHPGEA